MILSGKRSLAGTSQNDMYALVSLGGFAPLRCDSSRVKGVATGSLPEKWGAEEPQNFHC